MSPRRAPFAALAALALAALLAAGCGGDDDDDATATAPARTGTTAAVAGGDASVAVSDNAFSPASVTVAVNHEVIWNWSGANPHSVVGRFDGQEVASPRLTGSGTFVFSFAKAGTFEYQCGVHGAAMSGKVTIQ